MLNELAVRNLGVISDLQLVFDAGMTAVTGETGAGKTLIVEAIALLSGQRADAASVRAGASEAVVEGRFTDGGEELVVTRIIPADGRSRAYVDGRLATTTALSELLATQVDLHAQHAHRSLTSTAGQRAALDRFAGIDTGPLSEAHRQVRAIEADIEAIGGDAATRERELELVRHQLGELDEANLDDPDEDEHLAAEQAALGNVVALREQGQQALEHLSAEGGATDLVGRAVGALGEDAFDADCTRLSGLAEELLDAARELRRRVESINEDPERLDAVTERRRLLAALRRRHGDGTLAGVIEQRRRLAARATQLDHAGVRGGELAEGLEQARDRVASEAASVGRARRAAAPKMADAVQRELRKLAMPTARFLIEVPEEDPGDAVQMSFTANPGTGTAPLARVASGGELARVMLAVRLVATTDRDTLVFDEVDAGIGGSAAVAVGAALARLGRERQVLVVTHLAQVASAADRQIGVAKAADHGDTDVVARALSDRDRVVELSRMLSGTPSSDAARAHARELLNSADRGQGDD